MTELQTENSPALEEASRELQAAAHDAQVAFDCIALGELDRAHTHALTAKVAADAAVTALAAELGHRWGTSQKTPDPLVEHAVIPAPLQFDVANGPGFAFQPGTAIAYSDPGITPVVERFCAQLTRRTGVCDLGCRCGTTRWDTDRRRISRSSSSSSGPRTSWTGSPRQPAFAGWRRASRRTVLAADRRRPGRPARRGTGRRRARPHHADPAGGYGAAR